MTARLHDHDDRRPRRPQSPVVRNVASVLFLVAATAAVVVFLVDRREKFAPDTLLVVDGKQYGRTEFELFRGRKTTFANLASAERALKRFADHLVLERAGQLELASVTIDAAAVDSYYRSHRDEFIRSPRVRLAWFAVPRSGDEREARRAIESLHIRAQLDLEPEDFARLLAAPGGAAQGREIGPLDCSSPAQPPVVPEVLQAGCALADGGLSEPIETEAAYYVVRRTATYPGRYRSLADARPRIHARLAQKLRAEVRAETLAELRANADIQILAEAIAELVDSPKAPRTPSDRPPRAPDAGRTS